MILLATLLINQSITEIAMCLRYIVVLGLKVSKLIIGIKVIMDRELLVEALIVVL